MPLAVFVAMVMSFSGNNEAFNLDYITKSGTVAHCVVQCVRVLHGSREKCLRCISSHMPEVTQVPRAYAADMLHLGKDSYTHAWCAKRDLHPEQGVHVEHSPSGWNPVTGPNGDVTGYTGCEKTTDFPGDHTVSHQSQAYVRAALKEVPRRSEAGEIWRGNELGFTVSNSLFWQDVSPRSVLFGIRPNQHKAVRPILADILKCGDGCVSRLRQSAREFLYVRSALRLPDHIHQWVHTELLSAIFPGEPSPMDAADFVDTMRNFHELQLAAQLVPPFLATTISAEIYAKIKKYTDALRPLTLKHYGARLAGLDCSPTPGGCLDQLTSALLDVLLVAGGPTVSSGLTAALWVLYGRVSPYGDTFPTGYEYDRDSPAPFLYESLRFFAPVVGFPYWAPPPQRASNDFADQFAEGRRVVLNLALANRDPNAWGPDGHKFRVRGLGEYHRHFVGFAEAASDSGVAGGAMDRSCAGKTLALEMGKAFLSSFVQGDWRVDQASGGYHHSAPYVEPFTLARKA